MSKYIIEVDDNAVDGLFKVKGFNTLVFDQDGLDRLQKYEEVVEDAKKGLPFPQLGDQYWYICSNGVVSSSIYDGLTVDQGRMLFGNCFPTEEETKFAAEKLNVLTEMSKFAEPFGMKWDGETYHYYIFYSIRDKCVDVDDNLLMRSGKLYFTSEKRARQCIEAVGEDRIKEFYFGVK